MAGANPLNNCLIYFKRMFYNQNIIPFFINDSGNLCPIEMILTMRLSIRFRKFINTALIIGPMTMIMAFVGVMRNYGLNSGWTLKCLTTWLTMFPIAYVAALMIIPIANKVTSKIEFVE